MKVYTYTFTNDPGHAWMRVPLEKALKVPGISTYSYVSRKGRYAYLEEDCDAPLYLKTMHPEGNFKIKERVLKGYARIRNLPHYSTKEASHV